MDGGLWRTTENKEELAEHEDLLWPVWPRILHVSCHLEQDTCDLRDRLFCMNREGLPNCKDSYIFFLLCNAWAILLTLPLCGISSAIQTCRYDRFADIRTDRRRDRACDKRGTRQVGPCGSNINGSEYSIKWMTNDLKVASQVMMQIY